MNTLKSLIALILVTFAFSAMASENLAAEDCKATYSSQGRYDGKIVVNEDQTEEEQQTEEESKVTEE